MRKASALDSSFILHISSVNSQRLRRSRRALRFLLPTLRRRRGLAMCESPFGVQVRFYRSSVSFRSRVRIKSPGRVAYRGGEITSSDDIFPRLHCTRRGKMRAGTSIALTDGAVSLPRRNA